MKLEIQFLIRFFKGLANAYNRWKKNKYANDPASAISNSDDDERVQSKQTDTDVATKSKR